MGAEYSMQRPTGYGNGYGYGSGSTSVKTSISQMVIDFTASWCVLCRTMEPAINEFAAKYTDVQFIKIDVDESMHVANEFGFQSMPTFLLIKKGRVVDKITGARKEELQKKIEKHRANFYYS
ncbi:Monodehydroascorbate reductase (NADH) [Bertholletia excelsa]